MWMRLRIWLARILTRNTTHVVVVKEPFDHLTHVLNSLDQYVDKSGSLNSSGRIHAYQRIGMHLAAMRHTLNDAEVR